MNQNSFFRPPQYFRHFLNYLSNTVFNPHAKLYVRTNKHTPLTESNYLMI
jgi:hypothetical protein